ncbi:GDP-L-fucose synthase [Hwanghaeella grinnelliae]|uniref:GDP-L-fucose synthase n=1 Tax=Hwanghaeella grinnelliae TaxID=2500179 RepID=A0A3S2Y6H5_9PROT|nr:GDP-L-fucose synthase [Hwanghaeella grinnelliae]RVU39695.1 GDP-L-fucose synthase [Hwanghaeella grinnelliae]
MEKDARIYVAGHRGLVGGAILRRLRQEGFQNLITRTHGELDLTRQDGVEAFFVDQTPDYVFLAAAKVGGIVANDSYSGEFIRDNLLIQTNVIDAAYRNGVRKLVFLGSTCIYPKFAEQPMREDALLTGKLEPTNSAYAVAKIAGIEMCQAYAKQYGFNSLCLMPTNLYGPGDNFDLEKSHVIPALMRKAHEAKILGDASMTVWGTGTPRREFLHVDDMADATLYCMQNVDGSTGELLNVGVGQELTIRELVETVCDVVGFEGELIFDSSKPDGTPRKLVDVSLLRDRGWTARIPFRDGLAETYRWYVEEGGALRA